MDLEYLLNEEGDELILTLRYPKDSTIDFPFLSSLEFEELAIGENGVEIRFKRNEGIEDILEKGVIINSHPHPILVHLPEKCPECGGIDLLVDGESGEKVCKTCGLVISEPILDERAEWRAYTPEEAERKERVGPPHTFTVHETLTTVISHKDVDSWGRPISPEQVNAFRRLRKSQKKYRILNHKEYSLALSLDLLNRICERHALPRAIKEEAARIYRKAVDKGLSSGRSRESLVRAAILMSCRVHGIPRTPQEIAGDEEYTDRTQMKELFRNYRLLCDVLGYSPKPTSPETALIYLSNQLKHVDTQILQRARGILDKAREAKLTKNPWVLASAAIYIAFEEKNLHGYNRRSDKRITQRELSKIAGVTEVAIRNVCHQLRELGC